NRGKATVNTPQPIYDQEPSMVDEDDETSKDKEIDKLMALISLSETVGSTVVRKSGIQCYNCKEFGHVARECQKPKRSKLIEQDAQNVSIDSLDMSYDREEVDQNDDDNDLAKERELLASLIEKLKCKIGESKNRNKYLETSNKALIENLKGEIEDFKNKNKSLESSNNFFKEANDRLSETNNLLYADYKSQKQNLQDVPVRSMHRRWNLNVQK
nr:hypothetical protein [Tanacetum cinerariifolium]